MASRDEAPSYWGYTVSIENHSLARLVKDGMFDLTIATSKYGSPLADVARGITKKWRDANRVLVAFGAPSRGLIEIAGLEGLRLNELVDFVVNTVPMQGTETVRTEEAIIASLAILNALNSLNIW